MFHERLKEIRKERGKTQKELATLINVSERLYQSYEYGKVIPSITVLEKLCKTLNISADYLLGLTSTKD